MSVSVHIEQILYISTISPSEKVDLSAILASARRNNQVHDITGLLLFNGKRFLQVLEGPADSVTATYERITRDRRHRAQVVLSRRRVERREFGDWSMGFRDGKTHPDGELYESICAKVADAHPNLRAEVMAFARNI